MATGLKQFSGDEGLAPYGLRHTGDSVKGKGYFGELDTSKGHPMTEYSRENESGEYPLVVPTLTKKELKILTSGEEPTEEMEDKALSWAQARKKSGKSPFAEPTEMRVPTPKKKGGKVTASTRADGIAARGRTRGRVI